MRRFYKFIFLLLAFGYSANALSQNVNSGEIHLLAEIEAEEEIYDSDMAGEYLYAVDNGFSDGLLMIFDLSAPGSPEFLTQMVFEDFEASDVLVDGDHLYIAGDDGLKIFDIESNPEAPTELVEHKSVIQSADDEDVEWEIQSYIVKQGNILFANADLWSFMTIDMSDIYNPQFLDGFSFNWYSVDRFVITGENIGWMDDGNDLRRIDFSDPSNLNVALSDDENNYIETDGELYDFVYHNDTLFTAGWTSGAQYVAAYKLSERRLIDQIDIQDSLSMGFSSSVDFHPVTRRLVVRGVTEFMEISVSQEGTLTPIKMHDGEGQLKFHGDILVTEGSSGFEGFIYSVGSEPSDSTSDDGGNGDGDSTSTTTFLYEDFNGDTYPPEGWERQIQNNDYTWFQGVFTNYPFSEYDPDDVGSAVIQWIDDDQDEWLISKPFSLEDADNARLSFYIIYGTEYLSNAVTKVHINTDSGTENWTQLWETGDDGEEFSWRKVEIDLSAYDGEQDVRLAWQYVGNNGDSMGLDSIYVSSSGQTSTSFEEEKENPKDFVLHQNYPNPFNPSTVISYQVPENSVVRLKVYDMLGREVATLVNGRKAPGNYTALFDASHLSSGIYIYRLEAGGFMETRKMLLVK